ncbi:TraB/GumN family protein [Rubellimicrobium roseum]|uniref:TraB/GumN family protein n=1 Tax=Rubellimicrobium roseum TaxID=687525 RepID=A0A5C4NL14_9RHOB|nr:TraB/GumN family protein [Rubellimicrobium roseum]TNC74680.1 TraB/GumN family protein [Rubellimicrobium roseum]
MLRSLLRRAVPAIVLALGATAAAAGCEGGPSLLDRLDATARAELAARGAAQPFGQGLLWSATRGEAQAVVVGTMHLFDDRHLPLSEALRPAIEAADLLLLEATPEERRALERAIVEEPARVLITEGPTLPDLLGDDWTAMSDALRERGMPPILAAKFRPWFLLVSLSLPACAMADAQAGREGLDGLLTDAALAAGTPMAALEPWDTVFRLMEDTPEAEQIDALRAALADPGLNEEATVAMMDGYFAGRTGEILEMSRLAAEFLPEDEREGALAGAEAIEEDLLLARNRAWVPVIEEAAAANPRLVVAAGAGHLPGEEGLLQLLADRGWTVTPLDAADCCARVWDAP